MSEHPVMFGIHILAKFLRPPEFCNSCLPEECPGEDVEVYQVRSMIFLRDWSHFSNRPGGVFIEE